ncbi:MAG: DUF108 domain-containing protein [Methylobacteriaceae bacterium]|nr:DUF108 domain-containing protein [Methylobacteriaceae bacterium]
MPDEATLRYGLVGFGRIGRRLAERLAESPLILAAVLVRPEDRAQAATAVPRSVVATDLDAFLAARPKVAVECASRDALATYGPPLLAAGVDLLPLSLSALADTATEATLMGAALDGPGRIEIPAGAMASLDALAAAREDDLRAVTVRVAYPAARLLGTPAAEGRDLASLTGPTLVASGSARMLAASFPRHLNSVVGPALAGLGLDDTRVELVADPGLAQATFAVEFQAGPGPIVLAVGPRDVPLGADPVDYTTFSVMRLLRRRVSPMAI